MQKGADLPSSEERGTMYPATDSTTISGNLGSADYSALASVFTQDSVAENLWTKSPHQRTGLCPSATQALDAVVRGALEPPHGDCSQSFSSSCIRLARPQFAKICLHVGSEMRVSPASARDALEPSSQRIVLEFLNQMQNAVCRTATVCQRCSAMVQARHQPLPPIHQPVQPGFWKASLRNQLLRLAVFQLTMRTLDEESSGLATLSTLFVSSSS